MLAEPLSTYIIEGILKLIFLEFHENLMLTNTDEVTVQNKQIYYYWYINNSIFHGFQVC